MKPIVDLSECLRDSPKFRTALEESEDDIEQLELKLDKMAKLCSNMVDAGKSYVASKSAFVGAVVDLSSYFKQDYAVTSALNKLIQALYEIVKYHTILIDQAQRSICKNINNFIKNDIRATKETKRHFEKISDDYDQVLIRNSQITRNKPQDSEETSSVLMATRSCFQHTALDYVNQMSLLQAKKRYEVLDNLLSYMNAQTTFFHQGSDLCQDTDPFIKDIAGQLVGMRDETIQLDKQLEERHNLVTSKEIIPTIEMKGLNGIRIEGYLFKRTSNAFKTWNRRWFSIQNNQLVYRKRSKDDNLTVMEEDLRLCSVKPAPDIERRFCFEILSPSKSHTLQADSNEMYIMWLAAIQAGINAAIQRASQDYEETDIQKSDAKSNDSSSDVVQLDNKELKISPKSHRSASSMQQIVSVPGNDKCADCKTPQPGWASTNLGITLCIDCSGIHRSLGVHHSKVRSLNLDAWEGELVKIMMALGNDVVNSIYEANLDNSVAIPATPGCEPSVREAWIKAKYIQKAFVIQPAPKQHLRRQHNVRKLSIHESLQKRSPSLNPEMNRKRSACLFPELSFPSELLEEDCLKVESEKTELDLNKENDLPETGSGRTSNDEECDFSDLEDFDDENPNILLHKGAASNNIPIMCKALAIGADLNWVNIEDEGKTAIHQSVCSGTVMACEYLFLNGAKNNTRDGQGRTPLHLATELGNTGQVCLLLKRCADQHALDNEGRNALSVAVQNANADIVTLLRIARFNDEMKETEYGNTDDTFNEVVRDFSKLASDNPDKLKRVLSMNAALTNPKDLSEGKPNISK